MTTTQNIKRRTVVVLTGPVYGAGMVGRVVRVDRNAYGTENGYVVRWADGTVLTSSARGLAIGSSVNVAALAVVEAEHDLKLVRNNPCSAEVRAMVQARYDAAETALATALAATVVTP